jgi:hypothetical protein
MSFVDPAAFSAGEWQQCGTELPFAAHAVWAKSNGSNADSRRLTVYWLLCSECLVSWQTEQQVRTRSAGKLAAQGEEKAQ